MMLGRWSAYLVLSSLLVSAVCLSVAEGAGRIPSQVTGLSLSKAVFSRLPALQATWTTPQSDEPISQYHLQYRINGTTFWRSQRTISGTPPRNLILLTRLAADTEYNVRVRAVSAEGAGNWSAVQTERTYLPPPSPSHDTVRAVPVDRRGVIRVSWTAPTVPSGELSITGYFIRYKVQNGNMFKYWHVVSNSGNLVTGLNPGTVYRVYVAGVSAILIGRGSYCCEGTPVFVRTYNVPSQVSDVAVSKATRSGKPALRVTWTTPQSDVTISQYQVEYRRQGSSFWRKVNPVLSGSTITTLLEALDAGTVYEVRIRAVSAIGNGTWSEVESETTYNRAPRPDGRSVQAMAIGRSVIQVSWSPPTVPSGELAITGYSIQYKVRKVAENFKTLVVQSSPAGVTGLLPGTEYRVLVASVNALGTGEYCCSGRRIYVRTLNVTPLPNVRIVNSTLQSLSISWSVTSPQDVTNYIVFWWKESAEISKSVALDDTKFVIEGLLSNTAYHVVVLASGPLGNVNSTSEVFYTAPKEVQGSLVLVLSEQILKVSWKPSEDAGRSAIEYIVNTTTTGMDYINATSVKHPVPSVPISGLPQYSAGTVSVWVKNPGAMSKRVILMFRMVNIVTNVSGVAANWVDDSFTSLRVTVPEGGVYRISYWAVNKSNTTEQVVVTTGSSSQVVKGFSPHYFYTIAVAAVFMETGKGSVAIGVGITIAVAAAVVFLLLGLCCCWLARRRRHKKNATFLHFNQPWPWTLNRFTDNEPVALTDVVDPSADGKDQDHLHVQPTPDDGNADALVSEPGSISKQLFPAHVREMHQSRDEGFEREFGNISDDPNGSDIIAKQSQNKGRNRYLNTNTFDHSRVILKVPDENGSDYINASYIEGYGRSGHYIAAQGPKVEEVSIFWQMVMEHKPAVVVMLTKVEENGKRKCEQYWNNDLDNPFNAGKDINVVTTRYRGFADYDVRDLTVKNSTDRPHKLTHFQYTAWPDHGVPLHPSSLVKFVQEVRKVHGNSQTPMVVHCSAGVGRTGTFITLDAMMERLKERDDLNIFEFVNEMRTRRKQMVQTVDQYAFIHDALSDHITCGDTSMMAHELRRAIVDMNKKDGTGKCGFEQQFEFIGSVCKMPVEEDGDFAKKSVVAQRNRYRDKFPYSTNYFHIAGRSTHNASDYINASILASYSKPRGYVAAQAPLKSTRTDVWELIWQLKTKNIVLLGPLKEGKEIMCLQFWPAESVHSTEYGRFSVTLATTVPKSDWEMVVLQINDKHRSPTLVHEVTLFHFLSWPREGRPPTDSMLKMMGQVEKKQKDIKAPLMVMCDDGMSRSGVFITCMTEIERVKVEGGVDIFQTVKAARAQRPHMVYTSDQYKLCFEILQSYLDSFDSYANFKAV